MNQPLRVLKLISSTHTSGAERHFVALAKLLAERGHRVDIACPAGSWIATDLRAAELQVIELDMKRAGGLQAQREIRKLLKARRYDLLHAHLSRATYLGLTATAFTSVPLVVSVHVFTKEPIYRYVAHRRNRIVAVSNYIRGVLNGRGVDDRFIDVVYNGTDFADALYDEPMDVRREFEIPSDHEIVGLVGKVVREKGHLVAVEALGEVLAEQPKAHLLFVGKREGAFGDQVVRRAELLGVDKNLTFTGVRQDIARLFDSMSFSIMPSEMETFGMAVIECMARGRPVVASRVGGLCELIQDYETGLLVNQSPKDFAKGMLYMLGQPEERLRMGLNARRSILARFTTEHMVEAIEDTYRKAVRSS